MALRFLQRLDGVYSNTPETELFLDRHKPSYIGGMLEMANARLFGHWNHLTEGLRTGRLQNEAKDDSTDSPFMALYADPERLKGFLKAMSGISHGANMAIAKKAQWAKYKTFVDVGAAQGDLAVQIALANPHLMGIGFDLPPVGPIFDEYRGQWSKCPGQFSAGGFFHGGAAGRRGCDHDGTYSARLGCGREEDAGEEGL